MDFISDDGGETYNRCHFWSNFEIGDLNFWRSEAYMKYFEHLDNAGGFYYERWVSVRKRLSTFRSVNSLMRCCFVQGDAPVHSIGAALFAPKE